MSSKRLATKLSHSGLDTTAYGGVINPPTHRASTILFPDYQSFIGAKPVPYSYGRHQTPTTQALVQAFNDLCQAEVSLLYPSGLSAISSTLLSVCKQGDHLLIGDNCYQPTRLFARELLEQHGVAVQFFDCRATSEVDVGALLQPNTKLVLVESPGSNSFELADVQRISAQLDAAATRPFLVVDNTWASNYYYNPLEQGADGCLISASKYVGGHSDLLMGVVSCRGELGNVLERGRRLLGLSVCGDDAQLVLRGLRNLGARLQQHERSALRIADWLHQRPEVDQLLYPPHPSHRDHELWRRDYSGAPGLLGFCVEGFSTDAWQAFFDSLQLCGMGYGWGGFESLLIPSNPGQSREHCRWEYAGQAVRMHVGLEHPDDLITELERAFQSLGARVSS